MKNILFILTVCLIIAGCTQEKGAIAVESAKAGKSLIGVSVPDITLPAFHRGAIKNTGLRDYRGKWMVLFFYPSDFTFVCPTELKELADYYTEFVSMNTEILSVSTDSVYVHRAWQKSNESLSGVTYPMLSDRAGRLSSLLGNYMEDQGAAGRATYVVDPEGVIVACEFHHESIGRSADELLRKIAAAQAVREGAGGACPAGWKPGEAVIHPE